MALCIAVGALDPCSVNLAAVAVQDLYSADADGNGLLAAAGVPTADNSSLLVSRTAISSCSSSSSSSNKVQNGGGSKPKVAARSIEVVQH